MLWYRGKWCIFLLLVGPRFLRFLCVASLIGMTLGCDVTAIAQDISGCVVLPVGSSATSILQSFCESLDCNLQCIKDAVGSCYLQDAFITYDPAPFIAYNKAACDQSQDFVSAFTDCASAFSASCFTTAATDITNAFTTHYANSDYSAYKTAMCSATTTFVNCWSVSVTASCTATKAQFVEELFKTAYSYSACNTPQTGAFFTTYGTDLSCGASRLALPWTAAAMFLLVKKVFM